MKLNCSVCNREIDRSPAEVKRNQKLGRKIFCSLSCAGKKLVANIPKESKRWDHLPIGSEKDEYSAFRWHLKNCRRRNKESPIKICEITLEDLKQQWQVQNGICPYTGWHMKNMVSQNDKIPKTPDRASLDRIDSTKGYVKGNIQFISLIAQYAKNGWDGSVVQKFAEAVVEHSQT